MTRTTAVTTTVDPTVVVRPRPGLRLVGDPAPSEGVGAERRDPWDVSSWAFGPPWTYRLNTLYRRHGGAVVTATGCFDGLAAATALRAAVRPFEELQCVVVVDLCHASLGPEALAALLDAGVASTGAARGFAMSIAHADRGVQERVTRAGVASLLRPCERCGPPLPTPGIGSAPLD